MSHKDAPPETPDQIECREWWTQRLAPAVIVAWGRGKDGKFIADFAKNAMAAWVAARVKPMALLQGTSALLHEALSIMDANDPLNAKTLRHKLQPNYSSAAE